MTIERVAAPDGLPGRWLWRVTGTALLAAGCAGGGNGGNGDDGGNGGVPPPPTTVSYGIGAPSAALGQQPLAFSLQVPALAKTAVRAQAPSGVHAFGFPPGPDAAGDALPKVGGEFDSLTQSFTRGLASKLWIDLPASAGAHPVALEVSRVLKPSTTFSSQDPVSGEILVTRREGTSDFGGRLRFTFGSGASPVCLAYDAARDGDYEVDRCMTAGELRALWDQPDAGLAIPVTVQRAAGATYEAWLEFQLRFEFAVTALRVAAGLSGSLGAAPAGSVAATVDCGVYPPTGTAGRYTLAWLDRNGSGRFDDGDDVRLVAQGCWQRLDEGASGPGRAFDGTLELRGYERNVGAAPTFIAFRSTDTVDVNGVVTPQHTMQADGGFTLRAPGLDSDDGQVAAYEFDESNMLAAGGTAARSAEVYPNLSDFAYQAMRAVIASPTVTQFDLGLCRNTGSSRVQRDETAGQPDGLSSGDIVVLMLANCDIGPPGHPKVMDGSLEFKLGALVLPTATNTDWNVRSHLRLDLRHATASSTMRRVGEVAVEVSYVLGHSYAVGYSSLPYAGLPAISGVIAVYRNGAPDFQIGCTSAGTYRGNWANADHAVTSNHVVRTANRVFTIGARNGEPFMLVVNADGLSEPDTGRSGMHPISAPECVALGVPTTGVTNGVNRMEIDTFPAGDGGRVRLLLANGDTELRSVWTDWAALTR